MEEFNEQYKQAALNANLKMVNSGNMRYSVNGSDICTYIFCNKLRKYVILENIPKDLIDEELKLLNELNEYLESLNSKRTPQYNENIKNLCIERNKLHELEKSIESKIYALSNQKMEYSFEDNDVTYCYAHAFKESTSVRLCAYELGCVIDMVSKIPLEALKEIISIMFDCKHKKLKIMKKINLLDEIVQNQENQINNKN